MENNENKNTENTSAESSCPVEDTLDEDTADIKANEESKDDAAPERISLVHSVFEWIELFVLAFTVVLLLMTFIGRHSPVVGESMLPTLEEGDVLIVSDIAYTPKTATSSSANPHGISAKPILSDLTSPSSSVLSLLAVRRSTLISTLGAFTSTAKSLRKITSKNTTICPCAPTTTASPSPLSCRKDTYLCSATTAPIPLIPATTSTILALTAPEPCRWRTSPA